jgi:putative transposase
LSWIGAISSRSECVACALRLAGGAAPVLDVCRQIGISEATFYYTWTKKYADLRVSELRRLEMLEDENARLRRIVADLTPDKQILQDVVKKMALKAVRRRELAAWMQERFKMSVRRSCRLALLRPSVW